MRRIVAALFLEMLLLANPVAAQRTVTASADRDSISAILDRLAGAISSRDVTAASADMALDTNIVYITDGWILRGHEYAPALSAFYARLKSLQFLWRHTEIRLLGPNAAVATGIADIAWADTLGVAAKDSAVFTFTFNRSGPRWQIVLAQKSTYRR